MTDDRRGVSRRTVAGGAAWAAPTIVVAAPAPAFAASAGSFTLQHDVLGGCKSTSGGEDVYYYLNILNNTGRAITLTAPLVITLQASNLGRSKTAASSSYGTVTIANNNNTVTWTLPAGLVIPANSDVAWHFLWHPGQPTSVTATTTSPYVTNPTSNSAAGYGNGCTGEF